LIAPSHRQSVPASLNSHVIAETAVVKNQSRQTLRPLKKLCGDRAARDFGPIALKSVRQAMIGRAGAARTSNRMVGRLKQAAPLPC